MHEKFTVMMYDARWIIVFIFVFAFAYYKLAFVWQGFFLLAVGEQLHCFLLSNEGR